MSEPLIGEIQLFSFSYIPDEYWLRCDGRSVSLLAYQALYSVIGTLYGPATSTTFTLPNLSSRIPIGMGDDQLTNTKYIIGQQVGDAAVTLKTSQIPRHTHQMQRKSPSSITSKHATPRSSADVGALAVAATNSPYKMMTAGDNANTELHPATIGTTWGTATGGVTPHENRQPFLALTFAIAYQGLYPVRP